MHKDGLQAAIDFTKLLMALAGGGIALVIDPKFFAGDHLLKWLSLSGVVLLTVSVVSGLAVVSGGTVMLARENYDLESRYVKIPGLVNISTFAGGVVLLALVIGIKLFRS